MSNQEQHKTAPEDRVPWPLLIAYGMGGLIPIALFNIAPQLMGVLGNISLGLSAFWLGAIMLVPRLWDAFSDPVMGYISDNTRSRWGRRRPYIFIGGLAVAVSFVAIWWVPRGKSVQAFFGSEAAYNWFQLGYILAGMLIFFTATTIFEIPHGALGLEMSQDYHERTRLFSAKSFLGNLFAMGTPWLIALAGLEFFSGPGGDLASGMRYVSLFIAAILIPMAYWWFISLREPTLTAAETQAKTRFWDDMKATGSNRTFLSLVAIVFTLAMGFNFVQIFNYYITIFYVYGGNDKIAGRLLGIAGTTWAVTGLIAVFPLNWLSKRLGKNKTLIVAILLMCAAQLSKIVCYNPELPYLVLIPTVLLSAGMLMFFTLGSSMVGDVCDEDELRTGTRSEGSYYSVYWWFIKTGSAFASFVMGALLLFTGFDQQQNVLADAVRKDFATIKADVEAAPSKPISPSDFAKSVDEKITSAIENAKKLREHFAKRSVFNDARAKHYAALTENADSLLAQINVLQAKRADRVDTPGALREQVDLLLAKISTVRQQTPSTLIRLRVVEIGLPLVLSVISILLTLRYPLTEQRCYEIKDALTRRRAALVES